MRTFCVTLMMVLTLLGCRRARQFEGTQTSTDIFKESVGKKSSVGYLKVNSVAEGESVTFAFAAPDKDWKDPRPEALPQDSPHSVVARAGCKFAARRTTPSSATIDGQFCRSGGQELFVDRGYAQVMDGVLLIELKGTFIVYGNEKNIVEDFTLNYPDLVRADPFKLR
jgi:hypothetical protein